MPWQQPCAAASQCYTASDVDEQGAGYDRVPVMMAEESALGSVRVSH